MKQDRAAGAHARLPPRQGARQPGQQDARPRAASGRAQHLDSRSDGQAGRRATSCARRCSPRSRWAKAMSKARMPNSRSRSKCCPQIAAPALDGLKLEKLTVGVNDAEVDEAVARHCRPAEELRRRQEGQEGRDRRSGHLRFRRQARWRGIRRRHGRRPGDRTGRGPPDPRLRGPARRRQGRRRNARSR